MNKYFWLVSFLIFGFSSSLIAQNQLDDEKRNEIETQKVAYITQQLQLNAEEAALFWPLYNEMQKKIQVEKNKKEAQKSQINALGTNIKDEQYIIAIQNMTQIDKKISDIKCEYYIKMISQKHLPTNKIWQIQEAERNFHRSLFGKCKH